MSSRINKSIKESSIKLNKSKLLDVPNLLLSYTYFLNYCHTCHITIGYDTEDFRAKIVMFKNNRINIWDIMDWNNVFTNSDMIENFFFSDDHGVEFIEMPQYGGNVNFKLSTRNGKKCLISSYNNRKIVLCKDESAMLISLLSYVNSIMSWYNVTSAEVKKYYDRYLQICINNSVSKLSPDQFFTTGEQSYFNSSRIFNELPILCRKKINDDLSKYYALTYEK